MASKLKTLAVGLLIGTASLSQADVLEVTAFRALQNNPDMAVVLHQYYAAKEDVKIATGNFLPSVDLIADVGKENIERRPNIGAGSDTDLNRNSAKIKLSVPLFRGFANTGEYDRANLAMQANYYQSLAEAERLSLQISKAYLDTLSARDTVVMSLENLKHHETTYDLVAAREAQGVADKADVSQIRSRMARAKANLIAAKNNLKDAETLFNQLVGEMPENLRRPQINSSYLPESNAKALELAMANNQSLIASHLNVQSASANTRTQSAHYYPNLDFVADKTWNDNVAGFRGEEDEWRLGVEMNWNLYAGGRKSSARQKAMHQEQAAKMRNNKVVREVKANVDSSWNAYKTLEEELFFLQEYVEQTKQTQILYAAQFKTGRRTLLDLLDSQNELFQARKVYISADYDYLYAQYRVISSMSYMLDALNVNVMEGLKNEG